MIQPFICSFFVIFEQSTDNVHSQLVTHFFTCFYRVYMLCNWQYRKEFDLNCNLLSLLPKDFCDNKVAIKRYDKKVLWYSNQYILLLHYKLWIVKLSQRKVPIKSQTATTLPLFRAFLNRNQYYTYLRKYHKLLTTLTNNYPTLSHTCQVISLLWGC